MKNKLYDILTKYNDNLLYHIIQWLAGGFFGYLLSCSSINIVSHPYCGISLLAIFILFFRLFMYKYFVYLLNIIEFLKGN